MGKKPTLEELIEAANVGVACHTWSIIGETPHHTQCHC